MSYSKGKFKKFHKANSCKTADDAKTLNCESFPLENGTVGYAKIPIVIAEEWIQVDVESVERLPKPAREIKRIRKNVHLTQCKLVQSQFNQFNNNNNNNNNNTFSPGVLKLFLAGFVRKNIEYVPSCSGAVEHHTVDVPFHCVVRLEDEATAALIDDQQLSIKNGVYELVFNDKKGMGMDSKVQGFATYEYFNNMPFCQLEFAGVTELDIAEDWKPGCNVFRSVREKMIVEMHLKVLQLQQVDINGVT